MKLSVGRIISCIAVLTLAGCAATKPPAGTLSSPEPSASNATETRVLVAEAVQTSRQETPATESQPSVVQTAPVAVESAPVSAAPVAVHEEKPAESAPKTVPEQPAPPAVVAPAPAVVAPAPAVAVEPKPVPATTTAPAPAPVTAKPVAAQPAGPVEVVADDKPRTFEITAGTKDASHPFYNQGSKLGFMVDGVQGKELVLTRGVEYTFAVRTGVQHDFYFSASPVGWGVEAVTEGITGQFTYDGDVTFVPGANTPEVVYYQCRNHKSMGGKLHVVEKGTKVVVGQRPAVAAAEAGAPARTVTESQVKQKLGYAEILISNSEGAKRVAAGSNAEAKGMLDQARSRLNDAKGILSSGDNAKALDTADEALKLMTKAIQMAAGEQSAVNNLEGKYKSLLAEVQSFDESYQRSIKHATPKAGEGLDTAKFQSLTKQAQTLATGGQYAEANKSLTQAREMVTVALARMLDSQTVVADKNFATPKEEYEYELARYKSYEELIPLAIEQRQPAPSVLELMNGLVEKSKGIFNEGKTLADKQDYKMAIMALQAATENLERALRLAGVQ